MLLVDANGLGWLCSPNRFGPGVGGGAPRGCVGALPKGEVELAACSLAVGIWNVAWQAGQRPGLPACSSAKRNCLPQPGQVSSIGMGRWSRKEAKNGRHKDNRIAGGNLGVAAA